MRMTCGILSLALCAGLVSAADNPPDRSNPNETRNPSQGDNRAQADNRENHDGSNTPKGEALKKGDENLTYRQRMVTGRVEDIKDIDVTAQGKPAENHVLAKVKTYNDRTVVVDLGARSNLKSEMKAGDEIAAFGITGRLNDRPLIVASKIAVITPIQGREDIYESIPMNQRSEANNSNNQQFAQDALQHQQDPNMRRPQDAGFGNQTYNGNQGYSNQGNMNQGYMNQGSMNQGYRINSDTPPPFLMNNSNCGCGR